jgi:hypothetical protein
MDDTTWHNFLRPPYAKLSSSTSDKRLWEIHDVQHVRCVNSSGSIRDGARVLIISCFPQYASKWVDLVDRCMTVCRHTSELEPGSGK